MNKFGPVQRPRGLMAKASDFESEDWGFESLRGRITFAPFHDIITQCQNQIYNDKL